MPDFHPLWQDIPIFVKTYDLYKVFYGYLSSFPKKDRYTLGQRCEKILLEILESIISASNLSKQEKLPVLKSASTKLDVLKVMFKLCKELKVIDNNRYLTLDGKLIEIGRMLGGWIKTSSV